VDLLVVRQVSDLDVNSGLHGDVGDLTHNILGAEQLQHTLVDKHLESVVSVGTLSVGSLADHESEVLGRHAHRTVDHKVLGQCLLLEVGAHLLDGLALGAGQGDADTVDLGSLLLNDLLTGERRMW